MDHKQIRIEIAVVLPPIMLITGREWRPSKKELLQWGISYPDTDLPGELRRIEEWFQKHPDRRKTERGMHAFVKAWLDRKMHGAAVSQNVPRHFEVAAYCKNTAN